MSGPSNQRDYDLIRFPKDAWGKVPPFAYPTYVALLRFFGTKDECWPKLETIIEMTGMSERAVKRQLDALRQSGLIASERKGFYGRNRYSLGDLSSAANDTTEICCSAANGPCVVPPTAHLEVPPTAPPTKDYRPKTTKKTPPIVPHSDGEAFDTADAADNFQPTTDDHFAKGKAFVDICRSVDESKSVPVERHAIVRIGEVLSAHDIPGLTVRSVREVLRLAWADDFWRQPAGTVEKAAKHFHTLWEHFKAEATSKPKATITASADPWEQVEAQSRELERKRRGA